jgi:hypothetical protein
VIVVGPEVLVTLASVAVGTGYLFILAAGPYCILSLLRSGEELPERAWAAGMAGALFMVFGFTLGALTARRAAQLSGDVAAAVLFAFLFVLARHGLRRARGDRDDGR